jgi:hypothetical protein
LSGDADKQKCSALKESNKITIPCIEFAKGYFRLSGDTDRRKMNLPPCSLCLCGKKSMGLDSPEERSELLRLGQEAEDPAGVKKNDLISEDPCIPANLLDHAEKGFACVNGVEKKPFR